MKHGLGVLLVVFFILFALFSIAADTAPPLIDQPGTQPGEVGNLEAPNKCDNCHGGYDQEVEPAFLWRGNMMGNAGRDPIFWATMAIAEQDFDGSGDLCIRCHSTGGWYGGRSTPTDGSGLAASDSDGVDCDTCHKMTNPDDTEHLGVMASGFIANDGVEGFYGSGMLSLYDGNDKLGPYDRDDAVAKHQRLRSEFHRSVDFCGSCHDVSNPVVGNLAPNHGVQYAAPSLTDNVAFDNLPYMYGVVERTFSEFKASSLDTMQVSDYSTLPDELQAGALAVAGEKTNYEDGAVRYFSCQTCHMSPTQGKGSNKKGTPTRNDLPMHDMTGGNNWIAPLIKYQDSKGTLRLGGGLTQVQLNALDAGRDRAEAQLTQAASLKVNESNDTLMIYNLTGHKLISGYPEGRRMWLNIKWYDDAYELIREDGAYGPIGASVINPSDATEVEVESIIDLKDTIIYEAHYAITQDWAEALKGLGLGETPVAYDRLTGEPELTITDLADGSDDYHESFHFVLNNYVASDTRIPPYGMNCEEALKRSTLPVPPTQYLNEGDYTITEDAFTCSDSDATYNHFDEVRLNPSGNAVYATVDLLYQGTSWEYIQFLYLANNGENAFLGQEGVNMLDAWLNAGPAQSPPEPAMVPPTIMASATWGTEPVGPDDECIIEENPETSCLDGLDNDCDGFADGEDPDCQVGPPAVDCIVYGFDKDSCTADAACRYNKKKGCINR